MTNTTQQLPSIFQRNPDQQFDQMDALITTAHEDMTSSKQVAIPADKVQFMDENGHIAINAQDPRTPSNLLLTHYSLMQVCRMAKLDSDVVRRLEMLNRRDLAIDNLNTLFPRSYNEYKIMLIDGRNNLRALNGADYSRLWDYQMFNQIKSSLLPNGFIPAIPMRNCGALLARGRTALFRGDQTSFGFFFTADPEMVTHLGGLRQGIMIWNSEVGARSFGYSSFYFRSDSGTFLIGDIQNEKRNRFVHRGDINRGFQEFMRVVHDASKDVKTRKNEDMAVFDAASQTAFAATDEEAIEKLVNTFDMTKGQAQAVVKAANLPENNGGGKYLTVWSISLGIAWEAAWTSRAESMADDSMVATKVIRRCVK